MLAMAFGGHARHSRQDASDDESSQASRTSSKRRRDAHKDAYSVEGVTCVGCTHANRIGPVDKYINENVGRQSEVALWRCAAATWEKAVVGPCRREGILIPTWDYRGIAAHYRLHTTNQIIGRTAMVQSLTAMRCQVENCLIRVENGERMLDKANADLFLKVSAAESRERGILAGLTAGTATRKGGMTSGQKPAGED